uniref:Uncharacterized protein n=1 Tax=Rhizophora mucronata TaxID=61149 RepID=A0A2P2N6J8_RHIMU
MENEILHINYRDIQKDAIPMK